ncbi:Uncharacterised protein [Megamonas hypermegale]|uniref:Antitoxin VbhA domain-containing protein n=1 Tax=Megamonas hypermegale TaxID=158847 RepID=A0A239TZ75_9FIRM|nr:antitoxin VbhA family protein [Megamonas hypermegale]SNV03221.1 Uncharacterised protein [Megamonas hypermegale]
MISITERKRRYEDLAYAMGSCEMEGCIFTAEIRKLYERYANGELSLKELGDEIDKTLPKK